MTAFDFIDRLREGTESQRRKFAFIIAFSLTGIIFVGWLMSFSAGTIVYTQAKEATSTSPLAAIGYAVKETGNLFNEIKDIVVESKTFFTSTSSPALISN